MRKIFTKALCILTFTIAITGIAHAQFTISGEFRPRAEYRDGYGKLGDSSMTGYGTITGRSRILFDFTNDKIQTRFSLQHAFVYGENPYNNDTMSKNTVNIFEAWFRYNFTNSFAVKIGRTSLSYDDMRIFGLSNWRQSGATHDLVKLEWKATGASYWGDFGFAMNNTAPASYYSADYPLKNYKYLTYLYNQKKFFKDKLVISVMAMNDNYQKANTTYSKPGRTDTTWVVHDTATVGYFTTTIPATTGTDIHNLTIYARGTVGGTVAYNWKNLNVFGSGYYQFGHYKDGRKITAYFFGGWVSYRVVKPLTLLIGYEQLSGNNASNTTEAKTELHAFATPYATNHAFYGYMDIWSLYLAQDALHNGLIDLYGRATLKFSEKTSLEATYRSFSMPYAYLPAKAKISYQSASTNLGSELDMMFLYKPIPSLELNAAYCLYFQSNSKDIIDGIQAGKGRLGQFGYLMITYKPNFFTSEKK